MDIDSTVHFVNLTLEVFFLDLLLSGDNAVVIALACRSLPDRQRRQAMLAGTGIAIASRILLTLVASAVLLVPLLKLLGGVALTVIAVQLTLDNQTADAGGHQHPAGAVPGQMYLSSVIGTVVIADLVMSADNVVALAAVAKGRMAVLALGLLMSVPLLMLGSWQVTAVLQRYPVLTRLGGAMLGWFAGDIAVSDPLYSGWVEHQSPALRVVVPALVAAYVLLQSRIIDQSRTSAAALRPARKLEPRPIRAIELRTGDRALVQTSDASAMWPPSSRDTDPLAHQPMTRTPPESTLFEGVELSRADASARVVDAAPVRARRNSWAAPSRWLAIGAGGILALGAAYGLRRVQWMPVPADLSRYDCPGKDVSLYYRPGGQRIRITNGINEVNGVVKYDNQIDWGDYHVASSKLGFVPPTRVMFGNSKSLRIDGGMFEDVICNTR